LEFRYRSVVAAQSPQPDVQAEENFGPGWNEDILYR